jgi:hypothetical protein
VFSTPTQGLQTGGEDYVKVIFKTADKEREECQTTGKLISRSIDFSGRGLPLSKSVCARPERKGKLCRQTFYRAK